MYEKWLENNQICFAQKQAGRLSVKSDRVGKISRHFFLKNEESKPGWIFPKIPHVSTKIETKSLEMHVVK